MRGFVVSIDIKNRIITKAIESLYSKNTFRITMYQKRQTPTLSSKEAAIQLLSRRDHGQYELYQKLSMKGYEASDIEIAINFCLDHNYLY
ncbi:regulatory protein RecX, partial [Vibrio diabolicus]|uniref:regulatory protein RecX n=1 Tax=Vibrio diabolicus TaxID=50719 RepID=UPI00211AB732